MAISGARAIPHNDDPSSTSVREDITIWMSEKERKREKELTSRDTDICLRASIGKAPHLIQLQAAVPQTLMIIQSSLPYDVISTFRRPCKA